MIPPTQHILHKSVDDGKRPLNILCGSTHERANTNLAKTGHNFYSVKLNQHFKKWDKRYGEMPSNYVELKDNIIPFHLCFDLVLSQHKFGQYQLLSQVAHQLHIPLISLEHTTYVWNDNGKMAEECNKMRGDYNIFITDHSKKAWQWQDYNDTYVIKHGVDTDLFSPGKFKRFNRIMTCANDYIGRDYVLNYSQYQNVTKNLPTFPVGDTPGFSKPASNVEELVSMYQMSTVFLNTAHLSPIPYALLEAAACGCAIVSCDTCGIPEFFTNNVDAFLCKNDKEMREALEKLIKNPDLAEEMGAKARNTVIKKCDMNRFINEWNDIFNKVRK